VSDISILNGGFHKWVKEINELESSNSTKEFQQGKFTVHLNEDIIKNFKDMLRIVSTNDTEQQIVDARPPNLFNGRFLFNHLS